MATSGIVRKWMNDKGVGFLAGPEGKDVFVHVSALAGGKLVEGANVYFDILESRDGKLQATNVSGPGVIGGKVTSKHSMAAQNTGSNIGKTGNAGPIHPAMRKKMSSSMGRGTGVVRMFNEDKGFGFVVQDGGGPDLFFHRKDLPKLLPCPYCQEPFAIPVKPPGPPGHGAVDCPAPVLIKGGKVTFKIEMQPDGKMQAVDVAGPGVGSPVDEADKPQPREGEMSLWECDQCKNQFQALPGSLVKCPACSTEIQL